MTKRERERLAHQQATLQALGFTSSEADQLRRISKTLQRLAAILGQRNGRPGIVAGRLNAAPGGELSAYIQTDPRGAALYLLRPGDIPEGGSVESYYTNGICVY